MARSNNSKQVVLAFLSLGPRSGYDIQRDIQRSIAHFWSESYGQIYPALRTLVDEGLATVEREPQEGKPDRKVYTITERGREALQTWLMTSPEPPPVRNEMLLKLFVGWQVSPDALIAHVTDLQRHFAAELEQLDAIGRHLGPARETNPDAEYWLLTLRSGQLYVQARLQWCDEALSTLTRVARARRGRAGGTTTRTRRMAKLLTAVHAALFGTGSRRDPKPHAEAAR